MFKRKIEEKLDSYYKNKDSRILIITGARQIGKTYIIRETAKKAFSNYIEINLANDIRGEKYFSNVKNAKSFYMQLTALYGNKLDNVKNTIIFLDEIQTYPDLISILKELKEDCRYRFIASGSLLGITLKHIFIPIGYIEEYKMYPMDFEEFLLAYGCSKSSIDYLKTCFVKRKDVDENVHKIFLNRFKEYLITGGLPDSISKYLIDKNIMLMRNVQSQIFQFYKDDASRYEENRKLKITLIYNSLPSYMQNKVKRINFKSIENKVNYNLIRYQDEFDYLIGSGCTLKVNAVSNPKFPLLESSSKNLIKLYYNDVGILSNVLYKNNINAILNNDNSINLGSIYETACAIELAAHGHDLYYFDSKKVGEVDFLINDYDSLSIIPIEIKSGKNYNNFRAIPKLVKEPYNLKFGYILCNDNKIVVKNKLITIPIYMIMFL